MLGDRPLELGYKEDKFLQMLRFDPKYARLFELAFPEDARFTTRNVAQAIACFERTIISARSPYDRYHYGRDDNAISASAKRGEMLFFSQPLSCFRCHGGFNFSDATVSQASHQREIEFHNTGLPTAAAETFKTPTLRNIAVTAPYMHDGSIASLEAVLDHYALGGRRHPKQDPLIAGFPLTPRDRADLLAFLQSLTDDALLHDPRFKNPW